MTAAQIRSVDAAADHLLAAERNRHEIEPLTDTWTDLDLATAYQVQDASLQRRLDGGERVVGVKLGLTSAAKQRRMGIDSPLLAWLTDAMVLPAGDPIPQARLIHPRIEPEIAFLMGAPLAGPGVTAARAMQAVDQVYAAAEIIDSRFRDFRFNLPDVVADNASSAAFIIGPVGRAPDSLDLSLEACVVEIDGVVVDSATGAAVQGHPAQALALAANSLAARGHRIESGWLVLTGGMTDAVFAPPGTALRFDFTSLGSISVFGGAEVAAG
jgi:2-oxo-3-hexenedioate decarboxylase